jgi:hypothetical protein
VVARGGVLVEMAKPRVADRRGREPVVAASSAGSSAASSAQSPAKAQT